MNDVANRTADNTEISAETGSIKGSGISYCTAAFYGRNQPRCCKILSVIDAVSLFSDELTDAILEEKEITRELIMQAVRTGTIARQMTPVFLGSAYKNKAVQPLMDAVIDYLPSPLDIENEAIDLDSNEETVILESSFDIYLCLTHLSIIFLLFITPRRP